MRLWRKICTIGLSVVQAGMIIALAVVQRLTHKKAGVNHHLYYRRSQFNNRILTPEVIRVLTVVLVVLLIVLLVHLIRRRICSSHWEKVFCILAGGWLAVTVSAFYLSVFRDLYSYPYLMAVLAACDLLAGIQILLTRKNVQ